MQHLIKSARVAQARAQLSPREVQVHELMLKGYNNREIMDALQISLPTAKQYKAEVMRKLAVRSLSELISLSATEPDPSSPRR
jgi:DNA-binding CsgD family transcriptional regulator